jgi:hypothetical protein
MLLLCNTEHGEFALFYPLFRLIVQDRHGPATTASPGGEVYEQDFSAAKLRQRYRRTGRDVRQDEIGMGSADAG